MSSRAVATRVETEQEIDPNEMIKRFKQDGDAEGLKNAISLYLNRPLNKTSNLNMPG